MFRRLRDDLSATLRFYTRLPLPADWGGHAPPDFSRAAWTAPAAGAVIGACGGAAALLARLAGIPPLPAALCAIAALVAVTGALHEDGLADFVDGLGGATRERRLEIMRDSRMGSFGGAALFLSLTLRAAALASIVDRGMASGFAASGFVAPGVAALVAAGALSRAAGLLPMLLLAPARADGAGAAARGPDARAFGAAVATALALSLPMVVVGASLGRVAFAAVGAFAAAGAVARVAERRLGGYTGDVLGAAQQTAEAAVLVILSAG